MGAHSEYLINKDFKRDSITSIGYEIYCENEAEPMPQEDFIDSSIFSKWYKKYVKVFEGLYCYANDVNISYKEIPKIQMDDMLRCYMKGIMIYENDGFINKLKAKKFKDITNKESFEFSNYMREYIYENRPQISDLYFTEWKEFFSEKIFDMVNDYIGKEEFNEIKKNFLRMGFVRHNKHKWEQTEITKLKKLLPKDKKDLIYDIEYNIKECIDYDSYFKMMWKKETDSSFAMSNINFVQLNNEEKLIEAIQEKISNVVKKYFRTSNVTIVVPSVLNQNDKKITTKNELSLIPLLYIPSLNSENIYLTEGLKEAIIYALETEIKL